MFSQRSVLWTTVLCLLYIQSCVGQFMNDSQCINTSNSSLSMNYSQCLEEDPFESCPDPSLCVLTNSADNVGLAFGLTIGAGLATTVGALLPFIPFIKRSNTLYLAGGLALAAGVMLYVSFTEIWNKARLNFCCETPDHYEVATTACFFGGILVTIVLDIIVTLLQKVDCGCRFPCCRGRRKTSGDQAPKPHNKKSNSRISATHAFHLRGINVNGVYKHDSSELIGQVDSSHDSGVSTPSVNSLPEGSEVDLHSLQDGSCDKQYTFVAAGDDVTTSRNDDAVSHGPSIGTCTSVLPSNENPYITSVECDSRPCNAINHDGTSVSNERSECTNNYGNVSVNELFSNSSLLRMNAVISEDNTGAVGDSAVDLGSDRTPSQVSVSVDEREAKGSGLIRRNSYQEMVDQKHESFEPLGPIEFKEVTEGLGKDAKKLHKMGILTGLAIAIHNFPEGLATFVATLASPSLGVALCIAIALHNIPEGVCVAMPVYYATGSRWKGFLWAFLSGISEPLGALLGWLVLKDSFGPLVYGILFGIIAGMMVFISLKELLPTARKFDKTKGILVNVFMVVGMVVMALSLLLFLY